MTRRCHQQLVECSPPSSSFEIKHAAVERTSLRQIIVAALNTHWHIIFYLSGVWCDVSRPSEWGKTGAPLVCARERSGVLSEPGSTFEAHIIISQGVENFWRGPMPKSTILEVKRGRKWGRLSVNDAIARYERHGRCIKCHKPAKAHRRSAKGKQAAHVEHFDDNPKCSLSGR